eukprot:gene10782-14478_t
MSAAIEQRNQDATCYVGNLDEKVSEELLWELMLQAGPVINVHMPKDKVSGKHLGYGFVEYRSEDDADYAIKVLNMVKLYQKPIKVNKSSLDKKTNEVGANLFIGNLDPDVDEKLLYDTFSAFGGIIQTPKILFDPETGTSKGYGFVSYDSFESSDLAIECMNGQYLANRAIVVQYAFKKDTPGERHGSQAERILAASNPQKFKPNTFFSGGQGDSVVNIGGTLSSLQQQIDMQQYQLQLQMQQYQNSLNSMNMNNMMMQQMGGLSYGQLPMQMQPPLPMMPNAPPTLPLYMNSMGAIPPPPPMFDNSYMPVPPPPPIAGGLFPTPFQQPFAPPSMPPIPIPPPPPM